MSSKLRDLIRQVRACKTAQDERAVISKECAMIRTAFKENNVAYRHRNVAKLLFIHMLGYPSHFGQMECLKLIASPNFPEKRIGYLALMLLLDSKSEVLTLVTNSIKNDLTHPNQYVVGLALASVGNLGTGDMGRILIADVANCMKGSNPYLKKKAALVMIRVFKRVPEMIEEFADKVVVLLKERTHGSLIAGVQLMVCILELEPTQASNFARLVPSLVRLLRNLLSMGFSPEHDVAGITDPFLQVKLLRLLQLLGVGNEEASDAMNDILAQVATNTETAKNAGNAILYQCVAAIMSIEAEAGLRVLAVNILGRFLLNRDNNIRYVALNALSRVVNQDMDTVQRHRQTIVDCLKDPDVSIRQRALELIYLLTNAKNVTDLMREMLNYLVVAAADQKSALCSRIMEAVDKYAPSKKWRIDTLITMLSIAGNSCDDAVVANTILYVTTAEGLHAYTAHKLFSLLNDELSQLALLHVGAWCLGEYGNYLLDPCPPGAGGASDVGNAEEPESPGYPARTAGELCDLLEKIKKCHLATPRTRAVVLTCFAKLSQRLGGSAHARVMEHLAPYKESMDVELQQRAVEIEALLAPQWDSLRQSALEKMPPMDEAKLKAKRAADGFGDTFGDDEGSESGGGGGGLGGGDMKLAAPSPGGLSSPGNAASGGGGGDLLDLDDIFGGGAAPAAPTAGGGGAAAGSNGGSGAVDLMADLFSGAPAAAPAPGSEATLGGGGGAGFDGSGGNGGGGGIMDLFGASPAAAPAPAAAAPPSGGLDAFGGGAFGGMLGALPPDAAAAPTPAAPAANPAVQAFEKNGLSLTMHLSKPDPMDLSKSEVRCVFANSTGGDLSNFVFQAAVPKFVSLVMQPASSGVCSASPDQPPLTQVLTVQNSALGVKPLMFRLKIIYKTAAGAPVEEQAQVANFPSGF